MSMKKQGEIGPPLAEWEDEKTPRPWNFLEAIELKLGQGKTYQELGEIYGCATSTAFERLQRLRIFLDNHELHQTYREKRVEILSSLEAELVSDMFDPDRRLEEDKSTANVATSARVREWTPEERSRTEAALKAYYAKTGKIDSIPHPSTLNEVQRDDKKEEYPDYK